MYDIFEIYVGLGPRTISKEDSQKALGDEISANNNHSTVTEEEARKVVLSTGIIGKDGEEILFTNSKVPPKQLQQRIERKRLDIEYFPAKLKGKEVRVFVEQHYLFSLRGKKGKKPLGLLINHRYLICYSRSEVVTIALQDRKMGPSLVLLFLFISF